MVLRGARVNEKPSEKSLSPGMARMRDAIFAEGKVKDLQTAEDLLFSSSSAAAVFVLGYSASGPQTWKTKDGQTMKELEEQDTAEE